MKVIAQATGPNFKSQGLENNMDKIAVRAFVIVVGLTLVSGFSALAQTAFNFKMTTSFYAGNAKMPAGTYTLTPMGEEEGLFRLQNSSGSHAVILEAQPSSKASTGSSKVLFNRYDNTDYLEGVETSTGNSIDIVPSAAERIAAKKGTPQPHTVPTA
jgi:hypothetical protein